MRPALLLRTVVFTSGAILMALEMAGSRVLAPFFGNSIYVWGSLISIFLGALSLGYYLGGLLADRAPSHLVMGYLIAIPGLMVVLLPFAVEPVIGGLAAADLGPRLNPLLGSLALFFLPSVFLGTVSPYAVKLEARSLSTVGNTAGMLYAVSTAGSIAGTLVTSFFLIAWLGVRAILHTLGAGLLVLSLLLVVYDAWQRKRQGGRRFTEGTPAGAGRAGSTSAPRAAGGTGAGRRSGAAPQGGQRGHREGRRSTSKTVTGFAEGATLGGRGPAGWLRWLVAGALVVATLAALGVAGTAPPGWRGLGGGFGQVIFERDSAYHHILVVDGGGYRYLRFDASWQSGMDLRNPNRLVFDYTRYLHLAGAFVPDPRRALFIGLGGASAPKSFLAAYPELAVDAVEIDPEVVQVARRYFELPEDPRLNVFAEDGRIFLRRNRGPYDVAVLDAYYSDAIPFHLTTAEFMAELKRQMAPEGVVVSNIIGSLSGSGSRLFRSMLRTLSEAFREVYVFPVGLYGGGARDVVDRNIIVVATDAQPRLGPEQLQERVRALVEAREVPAALRQDVLSLVTEAIPIDDVPTLTDDYAPVDNLLHVM